jgi:DNA-binding NtrC family response regulator
MIGEQRAPHPFVTLNSAELSRELARSELFGHVRGAYTHATANRPGLVDKAGDGVLFLDEIGELSLDVQAELLRFLEDGSYRPVGSTELRHSNARVVAATHVDLDRAVQNNRFRRDLLARLRASNEPLELPPLRERREDILGWTQLFFRELAREPGTTPWTVGALECLLLYPWTENLRELHRVVGHAAEQSPAFPCGTEHLPAKLRAHRGTLRAPAGGGPIEEPTPANDPAPRWDQPRSDPPRSDPPAIDLPIPDPTRVEIEEALRKTAGRMRTAAQLLSIDRRKLYRLCDNFSIDYKLYRAQTYRDDEDDDRDDE